mgnify:CR=1 FL=1
MIFDAQALFSDDQAITATAVSTNVIDLGAPDTPKHAAAAIGQDVGFGNAKAIRIQVTADFATLTSLTFTLQKDTVENFASPETVVALGTVAVADLVAGYVLPLEVLPRGIDQQYLRLNYTVVGSNATAGTITAGLVFEGEGWSA